MLLFLLATCALPQSGVTIDKFTATYQGPPREEDLLPTVVIVDPDSMLTVAFYEEDAVLWAKATFEGELRKGLVVLVGPETDYIEGVTVDGDWLACTYVVSGVPLDVTGVFYADREWLDLTIEKLGDISLQRELVPEEESEVIDDTGDTGCVRDTADTGGEADTGETGADDAAAADTGYMADTADTGA